MTPEPILAIQPRPLLRFVYPNANAMPHWAKPEDVALVPGSGLIV